MIFEPDVELEYKVFLVADEDKAIALLWAEMDPFGNIVLIVVGLLAETQPALALDEIRKDVDFPTCQIFEGDALRTVASDGELVFRPQIPLHFCSYYVLSWLERRLDCQVSAVSRTGSHRHSLPAFALEQKQPAF